jgi:DDE family transposase
MSHQGGVSPWIAEVSSRFAQLTPAQARTLAYWSYGIVLTQSCGLTTVATFLATLLGTRYDAQRQQLREWCYDARDQRGTGRREVDVGLCFAPLLGWVLALWPPGERRLALALDATTLGQRFTVLAISVVYRGCAIPVAWHIVPATAKGRWRPHWERLLAQVGAGVPADEGWLVIVLADRGLYARWLFQAIVAQHWHPFLRINQQGQYRPVGQARFRPLALAVQRGQDGWKGTVECFASSSCRLRCTLLAQWTAPHTDPWLILTDLPPQAAATAWYGLRAWIECGFKDCKRGGWDWQQTKMTRPERASRLWLAMAVATLWTVSVGGAVEAGAEAAAMTLDALTSAVCATLPVTPTRRSHPRLLSCFRRGVIHIGATLLAGRPLPRGSFVPLPWPATFPTAPPLPACRVA